MSEKMLVEIELERYEELLDIESRVYVLSGLLKADKDLNVETMLRVLGTSDMITLADEIKNKREEMLAKFREEHNGDSV